MKSVYAAKPARMGLQRPARVARLRNRPPQRSFGVFVVANRGARRVVDDAEKPTLGQARQEDASFEDALRLIGAEILDEPVPERLRKALYGPPTEEPTEENVLRFPR
jgi:hypothetical protein